MDKIVSDRIVLFRVFHMKFRYVHISSIFVHRKTIISLKMVVNEFDHAYSKGIPNHCEGSNQLVNNKVRKNVYTDRVFSCLISHLAVECYAFLHESVFYASGKTWRQTSLYLQWGEIVSLSILFHYIFSHVPFIQVIKCKIFNYLYPNLAFLDTVIV